MLYLVLRHVYAISLRLRYAMPGTDMCIASLRHVHERSVDGDLLVSSPISLRACYATSDTDTTSQPTRAMRCPVLTQLMALSVYARAMLCPVLT
eukprot:3313903-Rhodomonas_salina.1